MKPLLDTLSEGPPPGIYVHTERERTCYERGDAEVVLSFSAPLLSPRSPNADFTINQRVCIDRQREGDVLCFLVVVIVLALALLSPLSASTLRCVSPRDEKYFVGPVIACRDGFTTFYKDPLNDGFCDCPDGTDEPGTSAYPESKFYCINVGDAPRFLFSSRVNDHMICAGLRAVIAMQLMICAALMIAFRRLHQHKQSNSKKKIFLEQAADIAL